MRTRNILSVIAVPALFLITCLSLSHPAHAWSWKDSKVAKKTQPQAPSSEGLDWYVFNTTVKGESGSSNNESVAIQYIQDLKKQYPDLTVIRVNEQGEEKELYRSAEATGKNRIVLVNRPVQGKEFLGYLDGSAEGMDRKKKGRKIKDVLFLGHGSPKGPASFDAEIRKDAHGVSSWQKSFGEWERDLIARGGNPQDFFTEGSRLTFGNCNLAGSDAPQYFANFLPPNGQVMAADGLVDAGSPGFFQRDDLYASKGTKFESFRAGEISNSELTLIGELYYLQKEIRGFHDRFGKTSVDLRASSLKTLAMVEKNVKDFEPGAVRTELLNDILDLQEAARDGSLNKNALKSFEKKIKETRDQVKSGVEKKDDLTDAEWICGTLWTGNMFNDAAKGFSVPLSLKFESEAPSNSFPNGKITMEFQAQGNKTLVSDEVRVKELALKKNKIVFATGKMRVTRKQQGKGTDATSFNLDTIWRGTFSNDHRELQCDVFAMQGKPKGRKVAVVRFQKQKA